MNKMLLCYPLIRKQRGGRDKQTQQAPQYVYTKIVKIKFQVCFTTQLDKWLHE